MNSNNSVIQFIKGRLEKIKAKWISMPLRHKVIFCIVVFLGLWIWGFSAQIASLFTKPELDVSVSPNPFVCFVRMFTCGYNAFLWGAFAVLVVAGAFGAWWYRNHKDVPKTKKISRNGKDIRKIEDDGTMATGGELTVEQMEENFKVTYDVDNSKEIIFGKNYEDGRTLMMPKATPTDQRNCNSIVFGIAGCGKTTCYVYTMIAQLAKAHENMVITDPSGEIFRNTYTILKNQGFEVAVLNTQMPSHSNSWNFVADCGLDFSLAQIFATTIIENTSTNGKQDQFWNDHMINLLTSLIMYVNYQGDGKNNITEIVRLVTEKNLAELKSTFENIPFNSPARQAFNVFAKDPKLSDNILGNLGIRLKIFMEPERTAITSTSDIHITDLAKGDKPRAYYILTDELDNTYSVISSLFLDASFKILTGAVKEQGKERLPIPVHFIFDEFLNIGHIHNVGQKIATARKYNIVMHMILQSYATFIEPNHYRDEAETIFANCKYKLLFAAGDQTTAEYFSDMSGEMTVSTIQTTNSPVLKVIAQQRSTQQKRPVFSIDDIYGLDSKSYLLFVTQGRGEGGRVVKLQKTYYKELSCFQTPDEERIFSPNNYIGTVNFSDEQLSYENVNNGQSDRVTDVTSPNTSNTVNTTAATSNTSAVPNNYSSQNNNSYTADTANTANSMNNSNVSNTSNTSNTFYSSNMSSSANAQKVSNSKPSYVNTSNTSSSKSSSTGQRTTKKKAPYGLYNTDGSPRFPMNKFDDGLSFPSNNLFSNAGIEDDLEVMNKLPDTVSTNWSTYLANYEAFIFRDVNDKKIKFNNKTANQGKQVFLLYFRSYASCIQSKLPATQIRASGEMIDIEAITKSFGRFSSKFKINYWYVTEIKKNAVPKILGLGQEYKMPRCNVQLVPHFALIDINDQQQTVWQAPKEQVLPPQEIHSQSVAVQQNNTLSPKGLRF